MVNPAWTSVICNSRPETFNSYKGAVASSNGIACPLTELEDFAELLDFALELLLFALELEFLTELLLDLAELDEDFESLERFSIATDDELAWIEEEETVKIEDDETTTLLDDDSIELLDTA